MNFTELSQQIKLHFNEMQKYPLFRVDVTGLWEIYLSSFEEGDDPIFRDPESSSHNCNRDRHFIQNYGDVVAIIDGEVVSLWDIEVEKPYTAPMTALRNAVHRSSIKERFILTKGYLDALPYEKVKKSPYQIGYVKTLKQYTPEEVNKFGIVNASDIYEFSHFHVYLNEIDASGKSIEALTGSHRDAVQVLLRGLREIPKDTLELVVDLINQGSLLNADSYLKSVKDFLALKIAYDQSSDKEVFVWLNGNVPVAKFRNTLAGTLCVELSEGKELNDACRDWNKRADPVNYMKASAPVTQRMIDEAQKVINELGYNFERRFATIDDIDVNQILHRNDREFKSAQLFDKVKPSVSTRHKRSQFDSVQEVTIEKFMSEILPTVSSLEMFVENRMSDNFVALVTGNENLFTWNNPFSWTYSNNLTGKSQIAQNVSKAGGKIDGVLRFSIQWNEDGRSVCDFDAHCQEPKGEHIFFNSYKGRKTDQGGMLDVDMIRPAKTGVENITFDSLTKLRNGSYRFWVKNYDEGKNSGFKAEIAFNGETYEYVFPESYGDNINVASVNFNNGVFTITHHHPHTESNKEVWGITSNMFHKINLVCLSPNYWGENNVGNKHYMFFLDNCKSDTPLRSFHNEFLNAKLRDHRKALEILANFTKLEPDSKQLCGIGFNSTVRDNVILKLGGSHQRVIKITF